MHHHSVDPSLVASACAMTRQSNPMVYRLARLLYNRRSFPYFLFGYAYFRWLDDMIDAPGAPSEAIQAVAASQKALFTALYEGLDLGTAPRNRPEEMLVQMVRFDRANGCRLRPFIADMFSALEFDAKRRYQTRSQCDLDIYSHALGRSYTNVLKVFTSPGSFSETNPLSHEAGFAAHQVHILRDLYVDLSLGYCNVSREDLATFRWKVEDLSRVDILPWVHATACKARAAFRRGLQGIAHIPNPRCRLLGYATSAHYMLVLDRLQLNGYNLATLPPVSAAAEGRSLVWALRATFCPQAVSDYFGASERYSLAR